MGAYFDSGNTLQFHNLCSVVRVYVSNATNAQLPITSISLTAGHVYFSGTGTATIMGDSTDAIVISSANGSHSVSLCNTDNSTIKTVEPLKTVYFDVVIPEFSVRDDLTVTVFTPTGVKSITIEDAVVAHNTITTVTLNVDELSQSSAELVDGEKFRNAIPTNATAIRFEYNKVSVASGTTLSTDSSPYPIYGNMDGTIWVVSTPAKRMNANADCERMFGLWMAPDITSIDFGENFNTANVTNMSFMFYGCYNLTSLNLSNFNTANVRDMYSMFFSCTSLTGLDLSNFNTENVIYMGFMFDSCISLTSLNLSNFNTANVNYMQYMFCNCSRLTSLNLYNFDMSSILTVHGGKDQMCSGLASISGACAITCPTAVQTELQSGTDLVNSRITWYTH